MTYENFVEFLGNITQKSKLGERKNTYLLSPIDSFSFKFRDLFMFGRTLSLIMRLIIET